MENGVNERWGSLEGAGPWHYSLGGLFMARTGSFRASAQPPSMALQPALCSGMVDTFQGVLFKSVEELRIWVHCGEWEVGENLRLSGNSAWTDHTSRSGQAVLYVISAFLPRS